MEFGPTCSGYSVIADGRVIPKLTAIEQGNFVEFTLDNRFSYTVPSDVADQMALAIGNAMAIGAGWPCLNSDHRAPFAPRFREMAVDV